MLSTPETFGLVYIEAMSQGTPIIYSKFTGIDGFFKDGEVGYGIDPKNYNKLNDNIDLIIKNYKNISENCLQNSITFNWHNISKKYIQIYYNVIEEIQ